MEITLSPRGVTQIDDADYRLVWTHTWYLLKRAGRRTRYAFTFIDGKTTLMHRLIMGSPRGRQIDHINHDGLNNRRANLRVVTAQQNQFRRRKKRGGSSRYKGVCWNRFRSCWVANIRVDGKTEYLGSFKSERAAARAYDAAAKRRSKFSKVNFR